MKKWEVFSHDADIGIRGIGSSLSEAFEMAGMAITGVVTTPDTVPCEISIPLQIEENDLDMLFFEWVNQIIYVMDTKKMLFSKFEVNLQGNTLEAQIYGQEVAKMQGDFAVEIKGATFTELKVANEGNGWVAQCIVDI